MCIRDRYATLADAIAAANGMNGDVTITLLANCDTGTATMKNPLALTKAGAVLDLNDKTVTVPGNFSFVMQGNGIEVKNGRIISGLNNNKTTKINSYILVVNDCDGVKLTDLTMMGGVSIGGSQDDWGTRSAPKAGIAYEHGADKATNVVITDCDITSGDYYALCSQMNSTATINGGKFTANTANGCTASRVLHGYFTGTDGPQGSIFVTDGQFSGKIENNNAGWIVISGGIFSDSPETGLLKDGYEVVDNTDAETKNDYPHKVVATSVAQIGETKYATLAEAFEHAQDNDKIILLTDTSVDSTITVGSMTVELDLNGHVVTNNAGTKCRAFELSNDTNFTVTGTTAGSGMVNSAAVDGQTYGFFRIYNKSNATLTVNGGTYTGNTDNGAFVRVSKNSSNSVVNLTNVNVTTDWAIFDNTGGGAVALTMTGGTYTQNNVVNGVGNLDGEGKPVGAIHVTSRSNLVMDGVMLTSMGGTGVAVESQSTGTLTGCSITITGTENAWASCAVGIGGLSTVTLDGGTYTSGLHGVSYYTSGGELIVDGDATITGAADGIAYFYDTGYYSNLWKDYFPDGVPFYTTLIDGTINKGLVSYNDGVTNAAKNDSVLVVEGGKINGDYTVGGTVDTYDITGGKFTANPSDYVADGYEAVSITNEAPYTHQVGKITTTPLTANEGATDTSATYAATKTVVDEAGNALTTADTQISVTVTANQTETDTKATAKISNITAEALRDVVGNAADKAGDANVVEANVEITVAKSAPNTSTQGKAIFEVHPEAVITVGETETTVPLTNAQITGSFSFALNVGSAFPDSTKDFVVVHVHENGTKENLGVFTKDSHGEITLSNIEQFSDFEVSPLVLGNSGGEELSFEGGSLRRRVKTINGQLTDEVIKGFTDFRFGYQIMGYDASNQEVSYYFQWSKDNVNWSKAIPATHIDDEGHVSLVITSVPQSWYGNNLYSRLCKVDADGNVTMSATNERTVDEVANYYITNHTQFELRWVNYAKLLRGGNGVESYYVVRHPENNAIIGHKLNSSDEMISDGTMSQ